MKNKDWLTVAVVAFFTIIFLLGVLGLALSSLSKSLEKGYIDDTKEQFLEKQYISSFEGKKLKSIQKVDQNQMLFIFEDGSRLKISSHKYILIN